MGRKATLYLLGRLFVLFTAGALAAAVWCRIAAHDADGGVCLRLFAGIGVYALFLLNSCLLVWWLVRRKWLVALLPMAALAVGAQDVGQLVRAPHFGEHPEGDLRIATLNVHGFQNGPGRGIAARNVAEMLRAERIDIACFQEVIDDAEHPFDRLAAYFSDEYPYYVRSEEQAVFSRFPIDSHRYVRFTGGNQSCLGVDLRVCGRPLRVVSTHFQTSGIPEAARRIRRNYNRRMPLDTLCGVLEANAALRAGQVRIVRTLVEGASGAAVVAGDFNEIMVSDTYETLVDGLSDAFLTSGHGWGGTFGGGLRIDYILFNDWFAGADCYVVRDRDLSDHLPVVAALRFIRP